MNQFDEFERFDERQGACAVCEAMLPEAVDGLLSESEQHAFDKHVAGCVECARELAEARRGAAWLSMLKSQVPEPPSGLLAKILAETTGAKQMEAAPFTSTAHIPSYPSWEQRHLAIKPARTPGPFASFAKQFRDVFSIESARVNFQPRMAMTAAMAFFSIALTLNLTGVRLRDLRASSFTPSAVKRTVADVDASATRMFQNNRAVYQVESRLNELRNDDAPGGTSPAGHR